MHTPTIALSGAAVLLFSAAASADLAPIDLPRRVRLEYVRGHVLLDLTIFVQLWRAPRNY